MKFKIIFKYILLISWMILIFWFSNQGGNISSEMSDGVVSKIIFAVEKIGNISLNYEFFVFLVRKLAHFSLYFVLGILWMLLLKEYRISLSKEFVYAILFCFLYACSDEFHQLFVPGRSGNLIDATIDLFGSLCSIFLISLFRRSKNKTI